MKKLLALLFALVFACALRAAAYEELHMQEAMLVKKQPDVVADTVTRTTRPGPVPVLLILRHTDRFPAILEQITITTAGPEGTELGKTVIPFNSLRLKQPWWHEVRSAPVPDSYSGPVDISVTFEIVVKKQLLKITNNNYRKSRHAPLRVLVNAPPLPRFEHWRSGDAHFHTLFSDNPVEYGAPVAAAADMAALFGLDWLAFTDHSFDLDDQDGDTTASDPDLRRWRRYGEEMAAAAAAHPGLAFVRGEELSCGNRAGQNVHMLVFNPQSLVIGNGDGYEGETTAPDHACADVTAALPADQAAFAAHPRSGVSPVEQFVINRGQWDYDDMIAPGLTGAQAWNHNREPQAEGLDFWTRALLHGKRLFLLGGSDAHGDFNREYAGWPGGLPFGNIRSALYVPGRLTPDALIAALRAGRITATSGPAAMLEVINTNGDSEFVGGTIFHGPFAAALYARSTSEFGPVTEIRVLVGNLDTREETLLTTYSGAYAPDPMDIEDSVLLPDTVKNGYVRLEVESEARGERFLAFTNPVWFHWDEQ